MWAGGVGVGGYGWEKGSGGLTCGGGTGRTVRIIQSGRANSGLKPSLTQSASEIPLRMRCAWRCQEPGSRSLCRPEARFLGPFDACELARAALSRPAAGPEASGGLQTAANSEDEASFEAQRCARSAVSSIFRCSWSCVRQGATHEPRSRARVQASAAAAAHVGRLLELSHQHQPAQGKRVRVGWG